MLTTIPEGVKEVTYSITHLCYNLFGYLPAPLLYGIVCNFTGGTRSRFGIVFLMMFSILGVMFLYIATCVARTTKIENDEKEKEKEIVNVKTSFSNKLVDKYEVKEMNELSQNLKTEGKRARKRSASESGNTEALNLVFGGSI